MWELYDALIEQIPDDVVVGDIIVGGGMTYVEANGGVGLAPYDDIVLRAPTMNGTIIGKPLKEVAECVKSWNFREASIGHSAINAWYNHPDTARKAGIEILDKKNVNEQLKRRLKDPFIKYQNHVKGKKVCVLGYFKMLEELFAPVCDLSVVMWDPRSVYYYPEGSYPFSACEYLLPECDYVFLTPAAIVDKTMPRLLELAENAEGVVIVGMTTPLSSVFFDYGVTDLSGSIVTDAALAKRIHKGAEAGIGLCQAREAVTKVEFLRPKT